MCNFAQKLGRKMCVKMYKYYKINILVFKQIQGI